MLNNKFNYAIILYIAGCATGATISHSIHLTETAKTETAKEAGIVEDVKPKAWLENIDNIETTVEIYAQCNSNRALYGKEPNCLNIDYIKMGKDSQVKNYLLALPK